VGQDHDETVGNSKQFICGRPKLATFSEKSKGKKKHPKQLTHVRSNLSFNVKRAG
jgi:hypothetical protein